ncbi:hypothetical protein Tco_0084860 [Tanacetum coccineum]
MSADSAVTYTSVHSEARSWSIPSEDPYEDAPNVVYGAATNVSRVCTWIHRLEDHSTMYIPEPEGEVFYLRCETARTYYGPRVDCSSVDTMETRVRDTERRMMAALEVVNLRVSYQVDVLSRESSEFYKRHHDAQKDRAAVRAKIEVLRREILAYEQESMETRQALARSEAYSRALEARVTVLETQACRHEWQHQDANDRATRHIMRIQALEAGARDDTLEDTGSSA